MPFLNLWPMFETFQVGVVAGAMLVDAEKKKRADRPCEWDSAGAEILRRLPRALPELPHHK